MKTILGGKKHSTVKDFAEMYPKDWELVEEFTLPENWCIIRTSSNYAEINKWAKTKSTENFNSDAGKVFYLNGVSSTLTKDHKGYTQITFGQFEKYIIMKDKEIIGYKLKEDCKQYNIAAAKIEGYTQCGVANVSTKVFYINENRSAINAWTNANVLDLWFEPVYKETKTLPEINGYKGEITQIPGIVKYGCDLLSLKGIKYFLETNYMGINRKINSVTLDSGVEITIGQLQQIVDYFKD